MVLLAWRYRSSDGVVPVNGVVCDNRRGRRRGVDLRAALGQAGERQIGGIAGTVGDGGGVEIDRGRRQPGRVLPGAHGVAEGQRRAAGTAAIGRGAAIVERQRRRAARHRHRLA